MPDLPTPLPTPQHAVPKPIPWRRVAWLEFWMCFIPPVGLWMLWRDTSLTRSAKLRLLTYTFLVPIVIYLAASIYLFHATEVAIQAGGGGF